MRTTQTVQIVATLALTIGVGLMLEGCSKKQDKDLSKAHEILSDNDKVAPREGPVQLQESAGFPVDDKQRTYAALADSDERTPPSDKPIMLGEPKPTK